MTLETRKVTISLPASLLKYADRRATQMGTSRSEVISLVLAEALAREKDALAAEGYRFYGQEAQEFAEASVRAFAEVLAASEDIGTENDGETW